ncbi:hypothetical protein HMPREF0005_03354 [Achromobacter xylosoxidans C54]|nr:hypothetical protein HMPREF0005_03354 [Achromobacter xylosoxidans C54]
MAGAAVADVDAAISPHRHPAGGRLRRHPGRRRMVRRPRRPLGPACAWGVALVAYAAWGLFGTPPAVSARHEGALGAVVGAITGLITAATGVFVIPAVPYLQALNLDKDGLIQAMGISFTVSTVALAAGLWLNGSYTPGAAGASVLMLLPALAGMALGQWLRGRLSARAFKQCFMVSLALLGAYQVAQGLAG